MFIPPYRITLSGGGLKGIAHVGALEVLQERGLLKALREYVGISAGALVAFSLCLGSTLSELRMIISLLDFGLIRDLDPETMLNFPETFGLDTGANLEKFLKAILRARRISPTITFAELESLRLGPSLSVIAMNMNTCEPSEFSAAKTPGTEVAFAVRASMSIPIYFSPAISPTGQMFADGGVYFSSPFKFLSDGRRQHTLSIAFSDSHKQRGEIKSLIEYLYQLYYCLDYETGKNLREEWGHQIMYLECGEVNVIHFEATQEEKMRLMDSGRRGAEEFIKRPGRKPTRRFSMT